MPKKIRARRIFKSHSCRYENVEKQQNQGNWVPYELKSKNAEKLFHMSEILLKHYEKKSVSRQNVNDDEGWIHYGKTKAKNYMGNLAN